MRSWEARRKKGLKVQRKEKSWENGMKRQETKRNKKWKLRGKDG